MISNKLKTLWAEGLPSINGWLSIGDSRLLAAVAAGKGV